MLHSRTSGFSLVKCKISDNNLNINSLLSLSNVNTPDLVVPGSVSLSSPSERVMVSLSCVVHHHNILPSPSDLAQQGSLVANNCL